MNGSRRMTMFTTTYDIYDIVKIPFPFTEIKASKVRPALIISAANHFNNDMSIMMMITSYQPSKAVWNSDYIIEDFAKSGLPVPSFARFKIFTLDHRLILGHVGQLTESDRKNLRKKLKAVLSLH